MYACDYLENGVLNVLRGVTFAAPAKVYLALYLNDPGEDGASGTEVRVYHHPRPGQLRRLYLRRDLCGQRHHGGTDHIPL